LTALARYHWPGNVREVQNVMAALAVAAPARGQVRPSLLPAAITGAPAVTAARLADARAQFERRFVEVALARAGGSRSRAARDLGISRQGLLKLMARLERSGR
jgi:transcriptional regulator with PAS, ATPase and Fis domain